MNLVSAIFLFTLSYAGVEYGKPIYTTDQREPASIGDATIINQDFFRVEAFGESRAKEHKKSDIKKDDKKNSKSEETKKN